MILELMAIRENWGILFPLNALNRVLYYAWYFTPLLNFVSWLKKEKLKKEYPIWNTLHDNILVKEKKLLGTMKVPDLSFYLYFYCVFWPNDVKSYWTPLESNLTYDQYFKFECPFFQILFLFMIALMRYACYASGDVTDSVFIFLCLCIKHANNIHAGLIETFPPPPISLNCIDVCD